MRSQPRARAAWHMFRVPRTFVSTYQVQNKLSAPPEPLERIEIQQRVAQRGPRVE